MSYYKNFADGEHLREKNIPYQELQTIQEEFEKSRNKLVFSFIPKKKNLKLLEIGSGQGNFAQECERRKIQYFGIEPEKNLARKLKEKGLIVKETSVPPIPFENESFDIVSHFHVLEHMENSRQAYYFISECRRVLKKEGFLIFRCPNLLNWGVDFWDVDYTHNFPTSPTRIKQLLYDCNFKIIHFQEISFFKPRHFGKWRYLAPRKIKFLNKLYPKISKFLGKFIKKDTELLFVCQKSF
jgi:SAM-dependent methyltransferase